MKLSKTKNKLLIKIEDSDNYDVTEDNGVVFRPTKEQLKRIALYAYSLDNTVLLP